MGAAVAIGGWLFRNRGWLPVPLLLVMLVPPPRYWAVGLPILLVGEGIRLWAVGHIGQPSRTRSSEVGPLVVSGPYRWVRNPLYLGNLLLFAGLGVLCFPSIVLVPLLAVHYHAIVLWEETNLESRLGESWRAWSATVPRWIPHLRGGPIPGTHPWSVARALRSERSTLIAIAVVLSAAVLRAQAL